MRVPLFGLCLGLLVGAASAADSLHVRVIGHYVSSIHVKAGGGAGVDVKDGHAYLVGGGSFLVLSVADPAHPTLVGSCDWDTAITHIDAAGDFVYVPDVDKDQLKVVSVADPSHPVEVGQCGVPKMAWSVTVSGSYAYVSSDSHGVRVISVADPANPSEVGRYDTLTEASHVRAVGDYAYVAASGGLRVLSVREPANPVELGRCTTVTPSTVEVQGSYAYVSSGRSFAVVSIADPAHPVEVSRLDSVGWINSGYLDLAGDCAFAATWDNGLRVVSIADPMHPVEVGHYVTAANRFISADAGRGYVYVGSLEGPPEDSYAGLWVFQFYKPGDLDVDNDSLDVVADTIRLRGSGSYACGEFVLANTSAAYNPDTADGPSLSTLDSVHCTGSLSGPGGTLDSILIPNLPATLAEGQVVVCSLAVFTPPGLREGDYSGSITVAGKDTAGFVIADTFYALVRKLGDLDVDEDSLDLVRDTMDLHIQPAGPAYSPYVTARFMLVNSSESCNPDAEDGPSLSPLTVTGFRAYVCSAGDTIDSIYLPNLPTSLSVGQAVECSLALVVPVGTALDGYTGRVTINALDTLGFEVRDSFFLRVSGPQPRENLDSLRVAPIPFKPNQNPEHDAIHFQGLSSGARVTVYDASGQSVWSATEAGEGHLKWDAKVASGIYVYLVVAQDGASRAGKLSVIR